MENKNKQNKNKKATAQISLGLRFQGQRTSGSKGSSSHRAVALPLQGHLPPGAREKSWTRHRRICEPGVAFRVIWGFFYKGVVL